MPGGELRHVAYNDFVRVNEHEVRLFSVLTAYQHFGKADLGGHAFTKHYRGIQQVFVCFAEIIL